MDFNNISDITLRLIDKIDNQWKLFFASNLGIALWIYSGTNKLDIYFTIISSIAYVSYSLVCCLSALRAYKFLDYAVTELKMSIDENNIKSEKLRKAVIKLSYRSRVLVVFWAYFIAIPLILFLFWRNF